MSISDKQTPHDGVEIVTFTNDLKQKVGDGGISPIALKKAQERFEKESRNFMSFASPDFDKIDAAYAALKESGNAPEQQQVLINKIGIASLDVKGNAATFGYPTLTKVAESLCLLCEMVTQPSPAILTAMKLHIDAFKALAITKQESNYHSDKSELVAGLQAVTKKVTS